MAALRMNPTNAHSAKLPPVRALVSKWRSARVCIHAEAA